MKDYKKRARKGYETGKHQKKIANRKERTYEKTEIKQELEEFEAGDEFRYKSYRHTPNEKGQLEGKINNYERLVNEYKMKEQTNWVKESYNWFYQRLRAAKQKWDEKYDKK